MDLKLPDRFAPDDMGMDELVLTNVDMIHFERMTDGCMWAGIYRGNEMFHVRLYSRGHIRASVEQEQSSSASAQPDQLKGGDA